MPKKIAIGIILLLLVGLSGYLGYRLYNLSEAHAALGEEFDREVHRSELLQRKYAEQKAQVAGLQRAKLTVEGLKRKAEMKVEALEKDLARQKAAIAAMENKDDSRVKALAARVAEKQDLIDQWKVKYGELSDAFKQAKKIIAERDATIAKLEDDNRELESNLELARRTRDRYLAHNKKLAAISQSILARYDEDGVFAKTILDVEPFTQIKKVELEKLIQAYLDQIDDQVIREQTN